MLGWNYCWWTECSAGLRFFRRPNAMSDTADLGLTKRNADQSGVKQSQQVTKGALVDRQGAPI